MYISCLYVHVMSGMFMYISCLYVHVMSGMFTYISCLYVYVMSGTFTYISCLYVHVMSGMFTYISCLYVHVNINEIMLITISYNNIKRLLLQACWQAANKFSYNYSVRKNSHPVLYMYVYMVGGGSREHASGSVLERDDSIH